MAEAVIIIEESFASKTLYRIMILIHILSVQMKRGQTRVREDLSKRCWLAARDIRTLLID